MKENEPTYWLWGQKMKGVDYYYREFRRILNSENPQFENEFEELISKHARKPNEVFLWLEERRKNGELPQEIDSYLTNFFWEIR